MIFVPDLPELSQHVPFPQLTLVDLSSARPQAASNTLVVYAGRDANREMLAGLHAGLERAQRPDAGLQLLVIVPEGQLAGAHAAHDGLLAQVRRMSEGLGLATVFAEDVGNQWKSALNVTEEQTAWRLTDPRGDLRWMGNGRITGDALTRALDHNLVASVIPKSELVGSALEEGMHVGIDLIRPDVIGSHCPPYPLGRAGIAGTVVTFVQRGSAASETHLRDLARRQQQHGDTAPGIVVVVGGAEQGDAEAYAGQFSETFVAMADPRRTITGSFGVRVWPTTFTLNRSGTVETIQSGVSGRTRRERDSESTSAD
jgi:hypothetical protein